MAHYFDPDLAAPHAYRSLTAEINSVKFSLLSDSHVYGHSEIDFGSSLLLETFLKLEQVRRGSSDSSFPDLKEDSPQPKLLDLGTGIGLVGIVCKTLLPYYAVTMTDISARACELAQKNAVNLGLADKVEIICRDGLCGETRKFDRILLNPPIHAGKDVCQKLYRESLEHLNKDGLFYIVMRTKQGAKSTVLYLQQDLNCEVLLKARSKGFNIYEITPQNELLQTESRLCS